MPEYNTIAGTTPDIDEQHEPRTVERDGEYMMSEIGDGLFVQWGTCTKCRHRVDSCTCAGGPVEPDYIERWRVNRFTDSFKGRGVEPALPVTLKSKDRRVNAVLRLLRSQGWTITNPRGDTLTPDTLVVESPTDLQAELQDQVHALVAGDLYKHASLEECVKAGDHLTDVDEDGFCNLCGNDVNLDEDERDHLETEPGGVGEQPYDPDKGITQDAGPDESDLQPTEAEVIALGEESLRRHHPQLAQELGVSEETTPEEEAVNDAGEHVDDALAAALERLKRAKEDRSDVGF